MNCNVKVKIIKCMIALGVLNVIKNEPILMFDILG